MTTTTNFQQLPSPNSKYPFIGPNYQTYGERPGWVYYPWTDSYYVDPKTSQNYAKEQGYGAPDKPGLFSQLAPAVVTVGALEVGKGLGTNLPKYIGEGYDAAKGALGFGTPAATQVGTQAGTQAAATSAAQGGAQALSTGSAPIAANLGGDAATFAASDSSVGLTQGASNLASGVPYGAVGTAEGGGYIMADGSTVAADSFGSSAASVLPYAGAALGAYGLYDIADNWGAGDTSLKGAGMNTAKGAAAGAAVGSVVPGIGTAIGAIVGALYGLAGSVIKVGKSEAQMKRDSVRKLLKDNAIVDDNYNFTNVDGSKFDIGLDGHARLVNDKGEARQYWDTDMSNPTTGDTIGLLSPLMAVITGGDKDLHTQFTGLFTNAVQHEASDPAEIKQNVLNLANQLKLDRDGTKAALDKLVTEEKITKQEGDMYKFGVDTLFDKD